MKARWVIFIAFCLLMASKAHADESIIPIQTLILEAQGEGLNGMVAVGEVVRNRAKASHLSLEAVCLSKKQFSCWDSRSNAKIRLSRVSAETWQKASRAWALSWDSNLTKGAIQYHAKSCKPYWVSDFKFTTQIKNHLFYKR